MTGPVRRIGFVAFESVNAFDLASSFEVFSAAIALADHPTYQLHVLSPGARPVTAESGLVFMPGASLEDAPAFDTIVVPGGPGLREPPIAGPVVDWLRARAPTTRRLVSVCTGVYGLAAAGLLDGRRATTHWRWFRDAQRRFPSVRIEPDRIFLKGGPCYTSGGISAGVDLCLALVEEDLGPRAALSIAREMLVYVKRSGGQSQYSEPLKAQSGAPSAAR